MVINNNKRENIKKKKKCKWNENLLQDSIIESISAK